MTKAIRAYSDDVPGACGISTLCAFTFQDKPISYWDHIDPKITASRVGGAGFVCAGFIDSPECRAAYEQMCSVFTLLYQTPVRVNHNSKKEFFFAVFTSNNKKYKDLPYKVNSFFEEEN